MSDFDPVEYGKLIRAVEQMETEMSEMKKDLKELVELANKSRGGFWVMMGFAGMVSSVFTWVIRDWFAK